MWSHTTLIYDQTLRVVSICLYSSDQQQLASLENFHCKVFKKATERWLYCRRKKEIVYVGITVIDIAGYSHGNTQMSSFTETFGEKFRVGRGQRNMTGSTRCGSCLNQTLR